MRTLSARLLVALSVLAPTVLLSHAAQANPIKLQQPIVQTNTIQKPIEVAPNLNQKLQVLTPESAAGDTFIQIGFNRSSADVLEAINNPATIKPASAVQTLRNLNTSTTRVR